MSEYDKLMGMASKAHQAGNSDHARQLVQMAKRINYGPPQPEPDMSILGRVKDNVFGVADGVESTGEYAANLLNKGGQGMLFGFGDEADAAVRSLGNGKTYNENLANYRQKETDFEDAHPVASTVAEVGGAIAPMALGVGMGVNSVRGAMALGAGQGAAHGFGNGEGGLGNRAEGAAVGAALGAALGGGVQSGSQTIRKLLNNRATRRLTGEAAKGAPTSEQLRAAGNAAYQQIDDAGVQIKPEAFDGARGDILARLRGETGFDELAGAGSLTPNSGRVSQIMEQSSNKMAQEPTAALPFKALDQMRRQAGAAAGNVTNKADQKAGMTIIDGMDDFVRGLTPDDVVAGDPAALQAAIPKARELWGRMSRSQLVDDAIAQEGNYVSGGASAIRNQFAKILRNPKMSRGFSEAERDALRRVVNGGPLDNIVNLLGGGLGNLGQIGVGAAAGGPAGAMAGAATSALTRRMSENLTRKGAETARAAIASGKLNDVPALPAASVLQRRLVDALRRGGNAGAN